MLEKVLSKVQKPARYTGGEWNTIQKEWRATDIKVAFAFPDVYEVGMSHLGLQILYHVVNQREDALMAVSYTHLKDCVLYWYMTGQIFRPKSWKN